jgi:hypothetical protein
VTAGRNWYQVYLLVLTAAFAVASWFTDSEGQTLITTFPAWGRHIWYGGLLVLALAALVGIAMHNLTGLLVERAALFVLAGLCGAYGLVFLGFAGRSDPAHAVYVVVLVLAYAAVNLVRATQIRRDVDSIRHGLRLLGPGAL